MAYGPAEVAHGPLFIGFIFNTTLLGTLTAQVHHYMVGYKKDKMWLKLLVYGIYLANLVNTVFMAEYLYNSLILHFDDPAYLEKANWVFATDPAMTGIIALMAQSFFAWRVYILTKKYYATLPVIIMTVAGTIGAMGSAASVQFHPRFVDFVAIKPWVLTWLLGHSAADVIITLVLVMHLRHKTGFPASDQTVDKIIRATVQTGLITTVCAIIDAVLFLVDPTGNHLIFNLTLAKLYSVTLLSSLNSRSGWSFDSSRNDSTTRSVSNGLSTSLGRRSKRKPTEVYLSTQAEVVVHVESHELRDVNTSDNHGNYSNDDEDSRRDEDLAFKAHLNV